MALSASLVAGALLVGPGALGARQAPVSAPAKVRTPTPAPLDTLAPLPPPTRRGGTTAPGPAGTGSAGTSQPPGATTPAETPAPAPHCVGDLLDATFDDGTSGGFDTREALSSEIQVVPDPAGGPGRAERVEVRADQYNEGGSRWRAELTKDGAGGANQDRDRCFAFAVYIPPDWVSDGPNILFTVHDRPSDCEEGRSPPLSFSINGESMSWSTKWDSKACSDGNTPEGSRRIAGVPLVRGAWVRWTVRVHWSYRDDGVVEVWRNDVRIAADHGPNCYNDDREMYLKIGQNVYDGFTTVGRYVSYFDAVRMGTRMTP